MNIYNKNGMPRDFSKGKSFNFSEWNPVETYTNDSFKQDFVTYNGNLYACIKTNANSVPGICKCWLLVLEKLAGVVFTPVIDSEGNLSWTTYVGAEIPEPVNITGPQGVQGPQGIQGEKGDRGEQGPAGENAPIPVFEINSDGHLILILNEEVVDLGKVVGEGGSIECDCITPEFQIIDGVLQVSYGEGWIDLGNVKGEDGIIGENGVGITSIEGPDISGIAGQTDTYTINLSDNSSYSFSITNGSDGNHIMFGNGTPENILDINSGLEYIFNPCGYIEEENISQIVANEGDVYINLLTGDVFEYSSEWICRGSLKFDIEEDESLFWNDYGY